MNYNTLDGYRDDDVYEASRCFTGWSYDYSSESPTRGEFTYNPDDHDRFQKYVLGHNIPRDQPPLQDGLDVLDILANHPGTATHIAWKLCVRFIADEPPQSIIDSTADVFFNERDSSDQIAKTLSHLLSSEEFKQSRMTKFKRPVDWMFSFMRALELPYLIHEKYRFESIYDNLGQPFYSWKPPDGAPDDALYWATSNNLMQRWKIAFQISDDWYKKYEFYYDPTKLMPTELETATEIADWCINRVIGRKASETTRQSVIDFIADGRNPTMSLSTEQIAEKSKHALALCATTPEFRREIE
jgi:uncharacterized protein (DUF1800 family)